MVWLVNGTIVNVQSGLLESRNLIIRDGKICDAAQTAPRPGSEGVVDLQGAFVLPGLFDCHVHMCVDSSNPDAKNGWGNELPGTIAIYAAEAARRMLMSGITTARDVGGWDYHEIAVREAINKGWIKGPRLHCAGRILSITSSTTPYYRGMYEEADGVDEVRRAARKQFARGAQFIKLLVTGAVLSSEYESPLAVQYQPAEIAAAVQVAKDNFSYVAAHAHSPDGIKSAVECGCRSIEHTVYGNEVAYQRMVDCDVFLVPTLCTTPAMFADFEFASKVTEHLRVRMQEMHMVHVENIRLARRLGVKIAMGSDAGTPGNHCGDNLQELEVMVREAGFSTTEALRAATIDAATMMRVESQLGSLDIGKVADLVVTRINPLDDISALRKIDFVMKSGRVEKNEL